MESEFKIDAAIAREYADKAAEMLGKQPWIVVKPTKYKYIKDTLEHITNYANYYGRIAVINLIDEKKHIYEAMIEMREPGV